MPPRFQLSESELETAILFDDGGMNLLSADALRELREIVEAIRGSNAARLVTFRSGRPAVFAAGADMNEMLAFTPGQADAFSRQGQELFALIESLPAVTVGMIDGDCFGGALDLVMAFDFRFATRRSRFSHPGAWLGIVTGFGGTSRWRRLLSRPAAHRLMLDNDVLVADEAFALGLVDRLGEDHDAELNRLATLDPQLVSFVKQLTAHAPRLTRAQTHLLADRLGKLYWKK